MFYVSYPYLCEVILYILLLTYNNSWIWKPKASINQNKQYPMNTQGSNDSKQAATVILSEQMLLKCKCSSFLHVIK